MELVSIIMPTYKRSDFIERALKSLLNQTYKNIEIIIIDDNSEHLEERKKTSEILDRYSEDCRIVRLENKVNLGGSLSRNEGIKIAKGKYITFLDDDDEYELEKVESQYNFYKTKFKNSKGIVYCQSVLYDQNKKRVSPTRVYIDGNKNMLKAFMYGGQANTPSLFISREILLEVDGFEKLYCGQEWYLVLKILLKGYEVYHMKDELSRYYEHTEERITTNYTKKYEGEKKLYEIKKLHIPRFTKEEQLDMHYKINIMLANYAVKISKKEVVNCLKEAKKYRAIRIKDILQLLLKISLNENSYNKLKKIILD